MAQEIKIIHTGDLHLGMTFKYLGDKSKLHRRDCQDVFSNIVDLCIKEKVDSLLIAGDLFDDPNPSKSIVTFVIDELKRLKEKNILVFIISGNHDPYKKESIWFEYKFPSNVIIFDSHGLEPKTVGNLTVYGIAYTNNTKEPLDNFKAEKSDNFKVGLIHGSTTNIKSEEEPEYSYRPIKKLQIDNSNLDYIALGHFHDLLEIKGKVKCFYSGSPEGLSFKNSANSSILLVRYSDGKVNVKPIKTAIREFHTLEVDCTKLDNDSELRKILDTNFIINYQGAIGFFTKGIMNELRLFSGYDILYEKVKTFVQNELFDQKVNLEDLNILRNLSEIEAIRTIVDTFKKEINDLTVQDRGDSEIRNYIKISKCRPFVVKQQQSLIPKKCVFNRIVGDSHLELRFSAFLENCEDVISYVKNYFGVHFKIDYKNADGNISDYYPDFVVKKNEKEMFIIETKGREDLDVPLKTQRLKQWCEDLNKAQKKAKYDFIYVDEESFDKYNPSTFDELERNFREYKD